MNPAATERVIDLWLLEDALMGRRAGESAFESVNRRLIAAALAFTEGDQTDAARVLHISKRVLNYHAANYGLRPLDKRKKRWAAMAAELGFPTKR